METCYNLNFLREYYGDDIESMKTILQLYLEETPKELDIIEDHINTGNTYGCKQATHKIKTNVAMLGIKNLGNFVEEMHRTPAQSEIDSAIKGNFEVFNKGVRAALKELEEDMFKNQ